MRRWVARSPRTPPPRIRRGVSHPALHGTFGTRGPEVAHSQTQPDGGASERGFLEDEKPGGGQDLVAVDTFALTMSQGEVTLVLNACRSEVLGQTAVEAAVATQLLEGGAASVVAMGYSVYGSRQPSSWRRSTKPCSAARRSTKRWRLGDICCFRTSCGRARRASWSGKTGWCRCTIAPPDPLPQRQQSRSKALPSFDALLDQARQDGTGADDAGAGSIAQWHQRRRRAGGPVSAGA